jgi:hypothetical protein
LDFHAILLQKALSSPTEGQGDQLTRWAGHHKQMRTDKMENVRKDEVQDYVSPELKLEGDLSDLTKGSGGGASA